MHIRTWQHAYADIFPPENLTALLNTFSTRADHWREHFAVPETLPVLFVAESVGDGVVGFSGFRGRALTGWVCVPAAEGAGAEPSRPNIYESMGGTVIRERPYFRWRASYSLLGYAWNDLGALIK